MKLDRFSMAVGALFATVALGAVWTFGPAVTPSEAQVSIPIAAGPTVAVNAGPTAGMALNPSSQGGATTSLQPTPAPATSLPAGPPPAAAPAPPPVLAGPQPPAAAPPPSASDMLADLHNDIDRVAAGAQRAMVLAVIYQVDGAGLHELEDSIYAGTIPPGALGKVRRTRIAVDATAWPTALQPAAKKLSGELAKLEPALRDENVDAAKGPADTSHDAGHDLSDAVYAWLSGGPAPAGPHTD